MKILITESQYRNVLLEQQKSFLKSFLDKQEAAGKQAVEEASKWVGFDYRFLLTYAMGIGGLLPTVTKWLYDKEPTLDDTQMTAIIISAISLVFFETKDKTEIISKMREKGLGEELNRVSVFLSHMKGFFSGLFRAIPEISMKASNILAYTFLLPLSTYITNIVPDVNTIDALVATIEGILMNKVSNLSGSYIKAILKTLIPNIKE